MSEKGVMYVPPPSQILPEIMGNIAKTVEQLGDADMALVGVADRKGGWNAALVARGPKKIEVVTWIGKSWGDDQKLDYGVMVMKTFKLGR